MKEIRLTFNADDFGEISKILIDKGIGFSVEPIRDAEERTEVAPPREAAPPTAPKRKATKKKPRTPAKRESVPISGVDRLREALTRKPATPEPAKTEPPASRSEGGAPGSSPAATGD